VEERVAHVPAVTNCISFSWSQKRACRQLVEAAGMVVVHVGQDDVVIALGWIPSRPRALDRQRQVLALALRRDLGREPVSTR